jgi:hypothetical protein
VPVPSPPGEPADQREAKLSLSLRLHVDFATREATVALDDGADPIRLVFDGDSWRPASPS